MSIGRRHSRLQCAWTLIFQPSFVEWGLPRHEAAHWVGPARGRKSTQWGANGAVDLSPFEFLDRPAEIEPPPLSPPRGPPPEWAELGQMRFRPRDLSSLARRVARDRHPQPHSDSLKPGASKICADVRNAPPQRGTQAFREPPHGGLIRVTHDPRAFPERSRGWVFPPVVSG